MVYYRRGRDCLVIPYIFLERIDIFMKKENEFQASLIKEIKERFPGAIVLKNDPNYIQGMPDLTVLHSDGWAMLEVKRSKDAPHQPNQDYYISKANEMQYGSFVYPENKEEVLNGIQKSFEYQRGRSRLSRG